MGGERFDGRIHEDGSVGVLGQGRCVVTVAGRRAERLATELADAADAGAQELPRRATGNFRRGTERRGRR